ncbi:RT0821/Lpp0805 family surface protein [Pseudomonas sp. R2.Fl]|nr:RT0821/Lpp0805 family surface protein [Pseudomonas sp. R2.Fl]
MEDIAKSTDDTKGFAARLRLLPAFAVIGLSLTGCVGAGLDLFGSEKVDRSISTSTVAAGRPGGHPDEMTVQNAVSSADLEKVGTSPLPWANAATGSAGVIRTIHENRDGNTVCREFTTTRHAYDGIASFDGKTCMMGDGQWHMLAFDREP